MKEKLKRINYPMLLLAITVNLMFFLVGLAIAFRSVLFIILFILLGFGLFIMGIRIKNKKTAEL